MPLCHTPQRACRAGCSAPGGAAGVDPRAQATNPPETSAEHRPTGWEAEAGRVAQRLSNLFPLWVALASGERR
jgi:hypothetical protein